MTPIDMASYVLIALGIVFSPVVLGISVGCVLYFFRWVINKISNWIYWRRECKEEEERIKRLKEDEHDI